MKTRQSWVASASMLETPAAVRPFVVVNPLARRASSAVAEVVGHVVFADPENIAARELQAQAFEQRGCAAAGFGEHLRFFGPSCHVRLPEHTHRDLQPRRGAFGFV